METMETQLPFASEQPLSVRQGKLAAYSNLSARQQIQYDDSYNNYLAYVGAQEYQMNEGIRIAEEIAKLLTAMTMFINNTIPKVVYTLQWKGKTDLLKLFLYNPPPQNGHAIT